MAKKISKVSLILLLCLFIIPLVSALPPGVPFESTTGEGLQFAYPQYNYVKANEAFGLHLHVINDTKIQTNKTTSCLVHLYNSVGNHIFESSLGWDSNNLEFEQNIAAGNFTMGQHAYIIYCNNTGKQNHLVSGLFQVTGTGDNLSVQSTQFYIGSMFIFAFLFVVSLFGFNALPNEDPRDLDGKLMDINWMKYLRYPVGIMAWGFLTMIFFLGWNIAESYLISSLVASIFKTLFTLNFYGLMIAVPLLLWHIVVKAIEDKKFQAMITRGIM